MKIPKKEEISVFTKQSDTLPPPSMKYYEYGHDNFYLGEIAGHTFNRYLTLDVRDDYGSLNKILRYKFGPTSPVKTQLWVQTYLSGTEVSTAREPRGMIEQVHENAIEELLHKSFDAIDTVHKLENSLLKRIKYVFTKKVV